MDIERVRKELQASALREFPNPERVGCPDPAVLDAMSRRTIEMTQAQLHHITHCSPCFQTFLVDPRGDSEEASRPIPNRRRGLRRRNCCGSDYLYGGRPFHVPSPDSRPRHSGTLDLRPLSEYRGTDSGRATEAKPTLILPRKNLHLTLYFPVGADEGQYTLQLLDGQLHTLLKQHLTATLQNHVVTASADLDLRSFSPASIRLPFRKLATNGARILCCCNRA